MTEQRDAMAAVEIEPAASVRVEKHTAVTVIHRDGPLGIRGNLELIFQVDGLARIHDVSGMDPGLLP